MNSSAADDRHHHHQHVQEREPIRFGPFEVTSQVFYTTPHSFALVNLKPLLPGHVLVCPRRPHQRLTELPPPELVDLFTSVQRIQRMLARHYFVSAPTSDSSSSNPSNPSIPSSLSLSPNSSGPKPAGPGPQPGRGSGREYLGSFNIALQDGPEAGQTVAHVHVHIIPRIRGSTAKETSTPSDELYDRMAEEDGNVGGWQWDLHRSSSSSSSSSQTATRAGARPRPGGGFPRIEDCDRAPRSMEEMEAEAEVFRALLREMEEEEGRAADVRLEVDNVVPF